MKTLKNTRFILAAIALVTLISAKTFAAVDAFIWFEDGKGSITKVKVNTHDGSFKTPSSLAQGTYTLSFHISRQQVAGSADRESSAPSVSEVVVTYQVQSPRDAQSGMATGRRMHKPFTITKEVDKASPKLMSGSNENPTESLSLSFGKITVDIDNGGISGKIVMQTKDGNKTSMDDWSK